MCIIVRTFLGRMDPDQLGRWNLGPDVEEVADILHARYSHNVETLPNKPQRTLKPLSSGSSNLM